MRFEVTGMKRRIPSFNHPHRQTGSQTVSALIQEMSFNHRFNIIWCEPWTIWEANVLLFERDVRARILEGTRHIFIPGVAAILTVWLVTSALILVPWRISAGTGVASRWIFLLVILHWDLAVSFAVAGAISAIYGAFLNSSSKQRYIAALFPVFFEILKWLWLLRFPLAPWIDPHHPPYRFATLPVVASITYWLIHIIKPAVALLVALSFFNRRFYGRIANEVKVECTT